MTREEVLEQENQALKELVAIQKQIIEALQLKNALQPGLNPIVVPFQVPYQPAPFTPWTPGNPYIITSKS